MSATSASKGMRTVRMLIAALGAVFAVLAAGCAAQRTPGPVPELRALAPGAGIVVPLHTGV